MGTPRIVIVGGGFGGLYAARALAGRPVGVTLVDRRNYHLFQPFLYQVATAGLSPGDIAQPIRHILRGSSNVDVLLSEAVGVDLPGRRLLLADGGLAYDALILAAGAGHAYFGHEEWRPLAPGLKDVEDALEMRARIFLALEEAERETDPGRREKLLTFAVVGAGPTGVELAGALAEITRHALSGEFRRIDPARARIVLIEAGPRLLPAFSPESGGSARETLERRGVEVWTAAPVSEVGKDFVLAGGRRLDAATVLWAAGVAASPLTRTLGLPVDPAGRLRVQSDLSAPGHPEVFAIGDMACFTHQTGSPLPGLAPVAIQMGRHAAANAVRVLRGEPTTAFRYRDRGIMAAIGRNAAVAEIGAIRLKGFIGWLAWLFAHILFLIGLRNRLLVLFEWAWAYATFRRGVRIITEGRRSS